VVVFGVLVVLTALGAGSLLITRSMSKKDMVFAIRENAFEAARAAAEEAALRVNNGAINVALDKSMSDTVAPIEVESVMVNDATLDYMGIPKGNKPKVWVRAAVVSPDAIPRKPPLEQLKAIKDEIDSRGYVGQTAADLQEFWARVDGTNTVFGVSQEEAREGTQEGIRGTNTTQQFWNMTFGSNIGSWGPKNRVEMEDTDNDPLTPEERLIKSNNKLGALYQVYQLFYTLDAEEITGTKNKKPSADQLKTLWLEAMAEVGKDAASRMESCGSNPNLAMSHLVGDLKTGQKIASGTEVSITSAYMQLPENVLANKTYLLEISSEMPYGDPEDPGDRGKVARYTTYRLFQKSEWEVAVENMTAALTQSLRSHGMSDAEIQQMFPPEAGVAGRDEAMPGSTLHYDPKKVVWDPVTSQLPGMVGAKMYPYTVANAYPQRQF
jgi:hypothetical protein